MISTRKAKQLDATTMFAYSHANTPLGQSELAYYLSYFINSVATLLYNLLRKHSYILLHHPHRFFQCLINERIPELSPMAAGFVELSISTIPCMKVLDYTVEPRLTATSIIRSPRYYGQFFFFWPGITAVHLLIKTLMRSPVNTTTF